MPYVPTPDKLHALGLRLTNTLPHGAALWHTADADKRLVLSPNGQVELQLPVRYDGAMYPVFCGLLPSEAFFDELLIAVGWQPAP